MIHPAWNYLWAVHVEICTQYLVPERRSCQSLERKNTSDFSYLWPSTPPKMAILCSVFTFHNLNKGICCVCQFSHLHHLTWEHGLWKPREVGLDPLDGTWARWLRCLKIFRWNCLWEQIMLNMVRRSIFACPKKNLVTYDKMKNYRGPWSVVCSSYLLDWTIWWKWLWWLITRNDMIW